MYHRLLTDHLVEWASRLQGIYLYHILPTDHLVGWASTGWWLPKSVRRRHNGFNVNENEVQNLPLEWIISCGVLLRNPVVPVRCRSAANFPRKVIVAARRADSEIHSQRQQLFCFPLLITPFQKQSHRRCFKIEQSLCSVQCNSLVWFCMIIPSPICCLRGAGRKGYPRSKGRNSYKCL